MALTARTADRHRLYESSVQDPHEEVRFIRRVYKKLYGLYPTALREDFCGTGAVCCEWVKGRPQNRAMGIDLDSEVLEWGRENNLSHLGEAASRVTLVQRDVLRPGGFRPHVVTAMNFSHFYFKKRETLLRYFRSVRRSLLPKGFLMLDIYGGPEALVPQEEETVYDEYSYVWDQDHYDPVTNDYRCFIHFRFPDGSEIRRAYAYDWRIWSLPEVKDALRDAGFSDVKVYWEGTDEDGDGNGVFRPVKRGDDAAAWVAYVVAAR